MKTYYTANSKGFGTVMSWASILDDNALAKAEQISRVAVIKGHVALMPDAHFGYGPPVGTAIRTKDAIIPCAVGVDIGCGMMAAKLSLKRSDLDGLEGRILRDIRDSIPSGVGRGHDRTTEVSENFIREHGYPPGLENLDVMSAAMMKRHNAPSMVSFELSSKIHRQFGTLGAGNHFVEVCEDKDEVVWLVLHSGSRGVGNVLATAHAKLASASALRGGVPLEDPNFAWFCRGTMSFDAYISDMLWAQKYAYANRQAMMNELLQIIVNATWKNPTGQVINCHHNYAEEVEKGVWLTRKGAINAEVGRMGIIPGSMGASTYIVKGLGCEEALNTAPHGAGRIRSRGAAKRELDVKSFKAQMEGKTWLDRDAEKLIDEAPDAYKDLEIVMQDSADLVVPQVKLEAFINYKGLG